MRTFYYEFADGYFCFTSGRLSHNDKVAEVRKHGSITIEKMV